MDEKGGYSFLIQHHKSSQILPFSQEAMIPYFPKIRKMKKNGLLEWNTLNEEQRNFVSVFFTNICSGRRCINVNCRNSPFDIMKCPNFKKWRTEVMLNKTKEQTYQESKEFSLNDYLKQLEKIGKGL